MDALAEITKIFGTVEMKKAARLYDRKLRTSEEFERIQWRQMVSRWSSKMSDEIGDVGFDLLERLLCLDASKRISAEDALNHPFLATVRE